MTIKDVAGAAGVSTQTVSRVLNNRPDVAPETFQRVEEVIKQLGFVPNALVRSLIQGRSHTLGVVAYGLEYFGPSRTLAGIEKQANELGYSIFLSLLHRPNPDDIEQLFRNLLARQVDGIIWAVPEYEDNRAWVEEKSLDFPVPMIFVRGMTKPTAVPIVGIDNQAIGYLATEHLLATGARRIGIVTGPLTWWEARERQRGWQEALTVHGLEVNDRLMVEGDWNAPSGERGLHQLLAQNTDLDAVFASNDQMALGILYAAHRLGRRVPEDLSVVGVDNIPESAHFWPPLTTVRQRLQEAGAQAVMELDQMIQMVKRPQQNQDQVVPNVTLLQPELIIRESSRLLAS
ncbi:MAG: LacI family transcriptional regulator [Chloroflexi bacterium]|nr:LacI family transcriptional regulator [Chloroflexota bacterium]MCI0578207.1 LacI family transcriptional regulator [Chloroflexota bacterium]MCI0645300.1 LacI family transcriptional regulator [Chloroflexota bacterium]MCI0729546.1 LacI family transcriptional regulator [Chloroflexota bacterium]